MTFSQRRTHSQWDRLGYDTVVWQISTGVKGKTPPRIQDKAGQHLHAYCGLSYVGTYVSEKCLATTVQAGASSETLSRQCAINQKTTI